jgi:hypothetical protein
MTTFRDRSRKIADVSPERIRQLVDVGHLTGDKKAGVWLPQPLRLMVDRSR